VVFARIGLIILLFLRFQLQFDYPGWAKWVFAHVPFAMWAYRAFLMGQVHLMSYRRYLRGRLSMSTSVFFLGELIGRSSIYALP
jgi:hypothetical protein